MSVQSPCPAESQVPVGFGYYLKLDGDQQLANCALPCNHGLLQQHEDSLRTVLIVAGILAMLVCFFALLTFLLNLKHKDALKYPERASMYVLMSHLFISIVLLTGAARHKEIGCHQINDQEYRVQGNNNVLCTVFHMVLLFFFTAAQIWCVIYAVGIYMISKGKWVNETMNSKVPLFHGIAWIIPAVIVVASLVSESIESDISSGICFVSLSSPAQTAVFFVAPVVFCSSFSILLSMIALCNFQRTKKHLSASPGLFAKDSPENNGLASTKSPTQEAEEGDAQSQISSLNLYIIKSVSFATLYFVLNILLLAGFLYDLHNRANWHSTWYKQSCTGQDCLQTRTDLDSAQSANEILVAALVKTLSWHLSGMAALVWICSPAHIRSWKLLCFTPTRKYY